LAILAREGDIRAALVRLLKRIYLNRFDITAHQSLPRILKLHISGQWYLMACVCRYLAAAQTVSTFSAKLLPRPLLCVGAIGIRDLKQAQVLTG
jgi:hypothetical protein